MAEDARDTLMRIAAFQRVQDLQRVSGHLTAKQLRLGFEFEGDRIPLVNPQRGIFKPRQMRFLLSIRTVFPRPGGRVWYDDQHQVHGQIYGSTDSVDYAFMGTNPEAADNRWLREAFENRIGVIYFLGIAPARYQAVIPAFISGWDAGALKARVAFGLAVQEGVSRQASFPEAVVGRYPDSPMERRYALQSVKRRLHQSSFRVAIIHAYRGRCAISGIPEPLLLDAAHIVPDEHEQLGQPVIPNGLPLSKIHHAAFDSHLIGVDPDYRLHVSDRLLDKEDGPLLESLKRLEGATIHLPTRHQDHPDPERLALRFESFGAAA